VAGAVVFSFVDRQEATDRASCALCGERAGDPVPRGSPANIKRPAATRRSDNATAVYAGAQVARAAHRATAKILAQLHPRFRQRCASSTATVSTGVTMICHASSILMAAN
jgi:hypothetical protein